MGFFGIGEKNMGETLDKEISLDEFEDDIGQIAVDIIENDDNIVILAPIAGIPLENIDLSFNESVLTISGKREKPEIFEDENQIIRNSECFWGKFIRNIILPENLDFDSIKAIMEDSLLIITINKLKFESTNIKINKVEG